MLHRDYALIYIRMQRLDMQSSFFILRKYWSGIIAMEHLSYKKIPPIKQCITFYVLKYEINESFE